MARRKTVPLGHAEDGDKQLLPGIVSKEEPKTFMEAVGKINATPASFDALAKQPDTGPTINLNFLRRPAEAGS